jgi:hypothetical protein
VFDPFFFVFWPGAIAVGAFVALPVTMGLTAFARRLGRGRNRRWTCGRCGAPLGADDVSGNVFVSHGVYICQSCAQVFRSRYRFALIAVPVVATLAGVATILAVFAGPQPASWYLGMRLVPVFLPSVGVGAAFWWRIRAAKTANVHRLHAPLQMESLTD